MLSQTGALVAAAPSFRAGSADCTIEIASEPPIGEWRAETADEAGIHQSSGGYLLSMETRRATDREYQVVRLNRVDKQSFRITEYAYTCRIELGRVATVFDTQVPAGPSIFRQAPQLNAVIDVRPNAGIPFMMACDHLGRSSLAVGAIDQTGTYRIAGRPHNNEYVIRLERREYGLEGFTGTQFEDGLYASTDSTFWFDAARAYADVVDAVSDYKPRPVPGFAYQPYYSTWYAFSDHIDERVVWDNAAIARDMGVGNFLIFIGWGACEDWFSDTNTWGDYTPCASRFKDLAALIARMQGELGLHVQIWAAPTWIGSSSSSFARMKDFRSKWPDGGYDRNLDPRSPQAREHIRERLATLAREQGVDGVYFDFLDTLYNRNDAAHAKDPAHFGTAYAAFLRACHDGFAAVRPDPMVELRLPFANLLGKHHASLFNTTYSEKDWERNRLLAVMLRPFARGVATRCDPLMITPQQMENRDEIGRMLSAVILCGPPGISMDLTKLEPGRRKQLAAWLSFYRRHAENLARGEFRPFGREYHYPEMMVTHGTTAYARVSRWETDEIPFPSGTRHAFLFT